MEKLVLICLLFGLATSSDVLDLSGAGAFDAEAGRHDIMLVEFFAPWCGHCKKLAPEYENAASSLLKEDPPVPLAKVDCTDETGGKDVCGKFGVTGYPTLKIFRNGVFSKDYEGPRNSDGIKSTMLKMSAPMSTEVKTVEEMNKALQGTKTVVAGFFSKDGKDKEVFGQASAKLFTDYKFVYSLSEEINKEFGSTENSVVLYRPAVLKSKFEDNEVRMTTSITKSNIEKFVASEGLGKCPIMTPENKDVIKKPVVVAYYKLDYQLNPKGSNYWRNRVLREAGKQDGVSFAVAKYSDFAQELESMGLLGGDHVSVVAWDEKGSKYKMDEEMNSDGKNLNAFVTKFLAGDIEPYLKSDSIPASNDGPVKVVVGKTFNDIVMDETKDVLIEFYAPWCGHCKSLEPKYNELAEKLKDVEHVVIAKMDATANDSPGVFEVSGFPTIYWAPMGKKSNPQKYQGGREVNDFMKFIKEESSKPVTLGDKQKKEL